MNALPKATWGVNSKGRQFWSQWLGSSSLTGFVFPVWSKSTLIMDSAIQERCPASTVDNADALSPRFSHFSQPSCSSWTNSSRVSHSLPSPVPLAFLASYRLVPSRLWVYMKRPSLSSPLFSLDLVPLAMKPLHAHQHLHSTFWEGFHVPFWKQMHEHPYLLFLISIISELLSKI